jgi:hypothetical protein
MSVQHQDAFRVRGSGHRLLDEQGMSMVFVSAGFMAFFAATTLAIDVGLFMTARAQAQNSADAAALAGATAFVYNSFTDRSVGGPAVQSAINTARRNKVVGGDVSINPSDVTFPLGPSGQNDRVQVWVYRTAARNSSIPTLIGPVFGINDFDIMATATAEAAPANAMTCVKPFTIPDRWIENTDPPWDIDSTFDRYDKKGHIIPNADVYIPPSATHKTWDSEADKGTQMILRAGTGNNIEPSFYFSWKMPGGTGGDFYRDNIAGCNTATIAMNTEMTQEPGNMVGPTVQGLDDLMALDPTAYWDTAQKKVVSPLGKSPRVFPIPLYDPDVYDSGKQTGRNASLISRNWIGFFLEGRKGNEAYGRIAPMTGVIDANAGPAPEGVFPRAIRLVK